MKRLILPCVLLATPAAAGSIESCPVRPATVVAVQINEVRFANPVTPEVARAQLAAAAEALTATVFIMANAFRAADALAGQPSDLRSHLEDAHRAFDGFRYCTLGQPIGDGCAKPAPLQAIPVMTAQSRD